MRKKSRRETGEEGEGEEGGEEGGGRQEYVKVQSANKLKTIKGKMEVVQINEFVGEVREGGGGGGMISRMKKGNYNWPILLFSAN